MNNYTDVFSSSSCEVCGSKFLVQASYSCGEIDYLCEECNSKQVPEGRSLESLIKIHFAALKFGFDFNSYSNYFRERTKNLKVRFINNQCKFDFAKFGNYFFYDGSLFVITDKAGYKDFDIKYSLFDSLKNTIFESALQPNSYIIKVLYAGHDSGFRDDNDTRIFTGDIVQLGFCRSTGRDPLKYFKKDRYVPKEGEGVSMCILVVALMNNVYQVVGDNHGIGLCHAANIQILGNVFYDLEINRPIDVLDEAMRVVFSGYPKKGIHKIYSLESIKDFLKGLKTPSFYNYH